MQAIGGKNSDFMKPSFVDVFISHLPDKRNTIADQLRIQAVERKAMLNQLLETMRAASEAIRMELLSKLLQKDDYKDSYDMLGKALDIARRIMRGEKVSIEEMRFLAQYFPELLFQALLLKQEDKEDDQNTTRFDEDELSNDSGSNEGSVVNSVVSSESYEGVSKL